MQTLPGTIGFPCFSVPAVGVRRNSPRPPWVFAYLLPLNVLRYRVLDRLPGGSRRRTDWGRRTRKRVLASYFATEPADVGTLP